MAEYVIADKEELVEVADAVRSVTGTSDGMSLSQMAYNIRNAGGGSNVGADMVLSASGAYLHEQNVENITIEHGNAQSLWEKMKKGERITVVLYNWFVYGDETVTYEEVNFDFVEIYNGDGTYILCNGVVGGFDNGTSAARGVTVAIQDDTVVMLNFNEINRDNLD